MRTLFADPVNYYLQCGSSEIDMNKIIGKNIKIDFAGTINCIHCGAKTKTSFHQGYCYSCFTSIPQCDIGVLHPEKDMSHLGISRDMEWAKENSLVDHYVYLAYTGDVKVGVTRHTQIPTRWIDQGAIAAIKLAKTPYRNLAGVIESALKFHISDKTNWTKMLQTFHTDLDLKQVKKDIAALVPNEQKKFITFDNTVTQISYPFRQDSFNKFVSVSLDKTSSFSSTLVGIKGQYLIFKNANVLNIRKHNGYFVEIEIL